ncbi:GNAT family N-acetyltransferase [Herbidospora cretacea]|uniref:GNAT family N-acetyltransferase n=1 Tax=Herbidospora cretacea TaxID=28444 RepID=UPI0009DFD09D|nr:GNAT family N-acetyltransferase [Herbidospora cretacea]
MADDIDDRRSEVLRRYAGLALTAQAGQPVTDASAGCLGSDAYPCDTGMPEGLLGMSLGCGDPVAVADLRPGDTVLDLGSGAGLDVLLSARRVGPTGKVYGLDGTPEMIALARVNAAQAGVSNVEFLQGHIEDVPLPDRAVDVVISNCVINLSADKPRTLAEAFRVLKPGGRFGVSDIIADDDLEPVGCAMGTLTETGYRAHLAAAGFTDIRLTRTSPLTQGLHNTIVQASKPEIAVRPMRADDAAQVLTIYQAGLDGGDASFETTAPTWETFTAAKLRDHRHVAVDTASDEVVGWVAASAVSDRCVYAGVVEHSVYVSPAHHGRGIGTLLLNALIDSTEAAGIWTIQSGVFPENTTSLRLHEKAGFRQVGIRERIGRHHDRWRDVVFIERRSEIAGLFV